ncbi:hypothetical protein [Robiginitalea marina]|uniref:Lipoprotein n=1 Tax=Robiginitalea marina TaxID=2954105 RepID=A0ABT1AU49_9FLAO|nr:hypothetical protein [Robiginitalea marina]MCO5723399.1 hypothetical protein [Robiginitalea marina]
MKKIIYLLLCSLLLTGCFKETQTRFSIDENKVVLVITQNTTEAEMARIASELKTKKNIDLDYSNSKFQANGKISNVRLEVDCNDGFKGSTQCSASALKGANIGFIRDYQTGSDVVFHIGFMK